jgi:tetratricopeptide (TPR) repeat protein
VLYWARRYDEALEKYRRAADLNPEFGSMRLERELLYEQMGRIDDWAASIEYIGGFDAETRTAFRAHGPRGYWSVWYRRKLNNKNWPRGNDTAEMFARVGDKDRAFEDLVRAIEQRDHRMTQLRVNPILDPLRSDPRFAELLRRMNLQP